MRKIFAAFLAGSLALCLTGCVFESKPVSVQDEVVSASEPVIDAKPETDLATEEKIEEKEEEKVEKVEEVTLETAEVIKVSVKPRELPESEALEFVKAMGAGFNLGNTFDSTSGADNRDKLSYETAWGNPKTTKENIQGLKAAGFQTIRIPVSWHNHVDKDFNIDVEWMDRVEEVVKWALDEDMYVILNIHHDNEKAFMYPSYECLDNSLKYVTTIWEQIAERFGDYDEHLVFESLNEPRLKDTPYEWYVELSSPEGKETIDCVNKLNQAAVDAIRRTPGEYNKKRFITVPGYCASPDFVVPGHFVIPEDPEAEGENRILITVHAYRPYGFALSGNKEEITDKFNLVTSGSELNGMFMKLYLDYIQNGTGVIIDEFGAVNRNGNTRARANFAAYFTANARNYGISVCWWDNGAFTGSGELFGIYRRSTDKVEFPEIVKQIVYYGNN